jgi:hypothetical protein
LVARVGKGIVQATAYQPTADAEGLKKGGKSPGFVGSEADPDWSRICADHIGTNVRGFR